jgi:glyoxalase family protein
LHHVTATVGDAQADLDCYAGLLGLRLVKTTINFDNPRVYHFYYGDERGTPGTLMTTFPYRGQGVPVGSKGAGQITATGFSVPAGTLTEWRARLTARGQRVLAEGMRLGEAWLAVEDPSGLVLELVETSADSRVPWTTPETPELMAIRGVHSVTLTISHPERSIRLLEDALGYSQTDSEGQRVRLAVNGGGPGKTIDIIEASEAPPAVNGLGTVHHVAMAVATPKEQLAFREDLLARGLRVTEVLDRQYFRSIYFREPGGVLYEIATRGPGFLVDEPLAELGRHLRLPPWEQPNSNAIAAGLPAVRLP